MAHSTSSKFRLDTKVKHFCLHDIIYSAEMRYEMSLKCESGTNGSRNGNVPSDKKHACFIYAIEMFLSI